MVKALKSTGIEIMVAQNTWTNLMYGAAGPVRAHEFHCTSLLCTIIGSTTNPSKLDEIPGEWHEISGKWREIPGEWHEIPGKWREIPGKCRLIPGIPGNSRAYFASYNIRQTCGTCPCLSSSSCNLFIYACWWKVSPWDSTTAFACLMVTRKQLNGDIFNSVI